VTSALDTVKVHSRTGHEDLMGDCEVREKTNKMQQIDVYF